MTIGYSVNRDFFMRSSPVPSEAARELIVPGLYGQGELSSGRAVELLGQQRGDFIRCAAAKEIPLLSDDG